MAMIKCPECGRDVSDRAGTCPQCGFPLSSLKTDGTVMIKIDGGLAGKVNVFETDTGRSLWMGRAGDTAVFDIDKPTKVSVGWGIGKNRADDKYTVLAKAGEKYELAWTKGFFTENIVLRKIDVIDSGR